jgi:hypothetical protein
MPTICVRQVVNHASVVINYFTLAAIFAIQCSVHLLEQITFECLKPIDKTTYQN